MKYFFFTLLVFSFFEIRAQEIKDSIVPILTKSIFFENNSYEVSDADMKWIRKLADSTSSLENRYIYLEGHTNSIGNAKSNLKLAENRTNAVKSIMKKAGIKEASFQTKSFGQAKPEFSNANEDGLRMNRRVKILIGQRFILRKIKGQTIIDGKPAGNVPVFIYNDVYTDSLISSNKGSFETWAPKDMTLKAVAKKKDHLANIVEIAPSTTKIEVVLMPIKQNTSLQINNISFQSNKNILNDKSKIILDNLIQQVVANPSFCFEIQGHVNAPHLDINQADNYLKELSMARAGYIYETLISKGVNRERMIPVGFGHSKMIYPKPIKTEEHMANQRVEVKILDCQTVSSQRSKFSESDCQRITNLKLYK